MKNSILLSVIFSLLISFSSFAQLGIYKAGVGAGASNTTGDYNTFVGDSAGYTNTSGLYNTFIGYRAAYSLKFSTFTQSDNTVIGAEAMGGLPYSASSTDNVIIGKMAGYNHYGTDAVIIGTHAGYNNENGADVVFVGEEAGLSNTTGDDNVFIGEDAGYNNTTASDNTFVGNQSGRTNTTGYRNVFVGNEAGYDNQTGYRNTFVGDSAGIDGSIGHHNTFLGAASGAASEYPSYNTFIGSYAGWDNGRTNVNNGSDGMNNTYLGYAAGRTNREGKENVVIGSRADFEGVGYDGNNYNVIIGTNASLKADNLENTVILGNSAHVSKSNGIAIGSASYVSGDNSVGIGTLINVSNLYTTGIGYNSNLDGKLNIALGYQNTISVDSSAAYGFSNTISGTNTIALGNNITSSASNSILLGGTSQHVSVGIGTLEPNQNASLDLGENNKGFLVSRMTTAELSAFESGLTTAEEGMMVFDTENNTLKAWTGEKWSQITNSDQSLTLNNDTLHISNTNYVSLKPYLDNTDSQDLSLSENTLSLTGDDTSVDLSVYLDNTDNQDLSLSENTLSLTGDGTSVDLSAYLDNTDNQNLSLSNNILSLSGASTTIDLNTYLDNTDSQNLTGASLTGTSLQIDIQNGSSATVDLAAIQDGTGTDDQTLNLAGNSLSIEDGNSVDLSTYLDNTDSQNLSGATLTGTTLQIDIENGTSASVDLSPLQSGEDSDNQNLTEASLSGTVLTIGIEDGSSVSVDLAPLFTDINNQLANHESRIEQMEADIAWLKTFHETTAIEDGPEKSGAMLYQNIPNPANGTTRIQYYLPVNIKNAFLYVYDINGNLLAKEALTTTGMGYYEVKRENLKPSTYFYSLIVNNRKVDTKRMVLVE